MLPSKVSDSPGLACLLDYQGGLTALCWLPSSAHRVQEQQEPLERHCAGHLSTLAPPGPGPQCCPDCPSGADCEEPTCHPPWSHWQKFGHSSSGPSLLSPQASRRCTHSPPHNHPTLQMRKLRPSQARGLTEDHPTGKWWSSDLSPAPSGGSFFKKKICFIDYAITVVPFCPLYSPLPWTPPPTHILPALVHVHGSYI